MNVDPHRENYEQPLVLLTGTFRKEPGNPDDTDKARLT